MSNALTDAQTMLDAYVAAELAVLQGKEYSIAGRTVKRSDLVEIRAGRREWQNIVASLSGSGGIKIQYPELAP